MRNWDNLINLLKCVLGFAVAYWAFSYIWRDLNRARALDIEHRQPGRILIRQPTLSPGQTTVEALSKDDKAFLDKYAPVEKGVDTELFSPKQESK